MPSLKNVNQNIKAGELPVSEFPSNKAAIVGVGETEYSTNSGRSVLSLAVEACKNAIADAGLTANDVDGILTFNAGDSVSPEAVASSLGLPVLNLDFASNIA